MTSISTHHTLSLTLPVSLSILNLHSFAIQTMTIQVVQSIFSITEVVKSEHIR